MLGKIQQHQIATCPSLTVALGLIEHDIVDIVGLRPTEEGHIMVQAPYGMQFQGLVNELKERGLLMRIPEAKQAQLTLEGPLAKRGSVLLHPEQALGGTGAESMAGFSSVISSVAALTACGEFMLA
ncbi:hypothetical protein E4U14_000725 [Claviceps sp. LM454 group G7]|nr:hypothetical protein E4U14_000725 [Claviceps sp. LM454 group G7]